MGGRKTNTEGDGTNCKKDTRENKSFIPPNEREDEEQVTEKHTGGTEKQDETQGWNLKIKNKTKKNCAFS